jgi:hypothetical protein
MISSSSCVPNPRPRYFIDHQFVDVTEIRRLPEIVFQRQRSVAGNVFVGRCAKINLRIGNQSALEHLSQGCRVESLLGPELPQQSQ